MNGSESTDTMLFRQPTKRLERNREAMVTGGHARMKEILSYLHIPKTVTMSYMYEANYSN